MTHQWRGIGPAHHQLHAAQGQPTEIHQHLCPSQFDSRHLNIMNHLSPRISRSGRPLGRWLAQWALLLTLTFLCTLASAEDGASNCNFQGAEDAVSAGTMTPPVNASAGTLLKTVTSASTLFCKNNFTGTISFTTYLDLSISGALVPGYTNVFQTNNSNLGVRYTLFFPVCNANGLVLRSGTTPLTCSMTGVTQAGSSYNLTVATEIIRIGTAAASGPLTSLPRIAVKLRASDWPDASFPKGNLLSGLASGSINGLSCSVTTPNVVLDLGRATTQDFAAGVGATSAAKAFPLSLNCQPGIKVGITLTDASNIGNRTEALQLASGSSASGVGVQVLNAGNPVTFGPDSAVAGNVNQWIVTNSSANGALNIPLSARFIRTGNVVPGNAKSVATFTMSYQ